MESPLYAIWVAKLRITPKWLCPAWRRNFEVFEREVPKRPDPSYVLRRIDTRGLFEPGNVHWTPRKESNPPKPQSNRKVPEKQLPFLLEMVALGTPIRDVAKAFDITAGGVRNILCRRGIRARQHRTEDTAGRRTVKLTPQQARDIRARRANGESAMNLAQAYSVCLNTIYNVICGKTWKDTLA